VGPQLLAFLAGAAIAFSPVWDFDVWFQLACGRLISALGGLPEHDAFSWTAAGRPWDTQEWLSQVLGYGLWRAGGLPGLTTAKALVAGGILLLVWRRSMRGAAAAPRVSPDGETRCPSAGLPWLAAAVCCWGAYVMRWHLVERPQVVTYLFLAFELLWLEAGRSPWMLVPLTVAWANLHGGSSLLGPGVFALWTLGVAMTPRVATTRGVSPEGETPRVSPDGETPRRSARRALRIVAAALPAGIALLAGVAVNPAGPKLCLYPWETMSDRMYMANVLEWIPPSLREQPEFFGWLLAAVVLVILTPRRHGAPGLLAGIVFTVLALMSRRHIPLAVIAVTPLAVRAAAGLLAAVPRAVAPAAAAAACAGFIGWAAVHGEALGLAVREDLYPAGSLALLRDAPVCPGRAVRVYTLHRWGGYLEWHLPQRFKTFIDGRQLVFGPELFADYYRILENTPEAPALLGLYAPDVLIVEYGAKVVPRLAADRSLALVHWDDSCLVYVHRAVANARWLAAHAYVACRPDAGLADFGVSPSGETPGAASARALAELDRAARETPGAARPWTTRARILLDLRRLDGAEAAAREALTRAPGIVPVLLTAFEVALARRDFKSAAAFVDRALGADRRGPAPRLAAARLAAARGDAVASDRWLAAAVRSGESLEASHLPPDPALADALRLFAGRRIAAGDRAGAADALRRAGNALYRLRYTGGALDRYREALALAPEDMRILHNIGMVLIAEGRFREGLVPLGKALELNPRSADTLAALGLAHFRLGDVGAARAAWRQALAINPDHADAKAYLQAVNP